MKTLKSKGLLITFEGGEGSGKSTLSKNIFKYFQDQHQKVVLTREPGGTELSDMIRKILLNPEFKYPTSFIGHKAELLLYLAGRAQHVEEFILPHLKDDYIVLCDRFSDATFAYQGGGRRFKNDQIKALNDFAAEKLIPHHTFLVDIDPILGLSRSRELNKSEAEQGELDRMEKESLAFHQSIRRSYLKLAKENPKRFTVINGAESIAQNMKDALWVLEKL